MPTMNRIKYHRIKAGLTQEELAEKIGRVRQKVSLWETIAKPSAKAMLSLSKVLCVDCEALEGNVELSVSEMIELKRKDRYLRLPINGKSKVNAFLTMRLRAVQ